MDIFNGIAIGFGIVVVIVITGTIIYGVYDCIKNKKKTYADIEQKILLGSGPAV